MRTALVTVNTAGVDGEVTHGTITINTKHNGRTITAEWESDEPGESDVFEATASSMGFTTPANDEDINLVKLALNIWDGEQTKFSITL